jgi:hypothetical protein
MESIWNEAVKKINRFNALSFVRGGWEWETSCKNIQGTVP